MSIETGGNNPLANLFFSSQRLLIVLPDFPWNTLDGGSLNSTEGILAEYRALPNPLQSPGRNLQAESRSVSWDDIAV